MANYTQQSSFGGVGDQPSVWGMVPLLAPIRTAVVFCNNFRLWNDL